MNEYHHLVKTSLGELVIAANENAVTGIYTPQHKEYTKARALPVALLPPMQKVADQLQRYMSGEQVAHSAIAEGTAFQQRVWQELCTLPYGMTVTYGELARRIGMPRAVRAVASAIARNPLLILVPCHRVIASSGALAGFAGGLEAKQWLLAHEQSSFSAK
jgi:methylated-DNA-[protein]-cysteine S-methyltransferase